MPYDDATHPASRRNSRIAAGTPMEPVFADLLRDPILLDLMASDRVQMDNFLDLIAAIRQRLGVDTPASGKPN